MRRKRFRSPDFAFTRIHGGGGGGAYENPAAGGTSNKKTPPPETRLLDNRQSLPETSTGRWRFGELRGAPGGVGWGKGGDSKNEESPGSSAWIWTEKGVVKNGAFSLEEALESLSKISPIL